MCKWVDSLFCGKAGRGSDSPPDCHSLPLLRIHLIQNQKRHNHFALCTNGWIRFSAEKPVVVRPNTEKGSYIFVGVHRYGRIQF